MAHMRPCRATLRLAESCTSSTQEYPATDVERTRHIHDSQGHILALSFRSTFLKPLKVFPLRAQAAAERGCDIPAQVSLYAWLLGSPEEVLVAAVLTLPQVLHREIQPGLIY
jgi:hypothetical protein